MRFVTAVCLLATCAQVAFSLDPDVTQRQRIRRLQESMLAPCCWAESVAVHRSEAAAGMRVEIEKFVLAGKSDREILNHYKRVHGPRVLIEPEGAQRTWVYVVPTVITLVGIGLVIWVIRRMLARPPIDQPVA